MRRAPWGSRQIRQSAASSYLPVGAGTETLPPLELRHARARAPIASVQALPHPSPHTDGLWALARQPMAASRWLPMEDEVGNGVCLLTLVTEKQAMRVCFKIDARTGVSQKMCVFLISKRLGLSEFASRPGG